MHPQNRSFEHRICAQTQDLQIFKKFNITQMNPKEVIHNTQYSVTKVLSSTTIRRQSLPT